MQHYKGMIAEIQPKVRELMPWDLVERVQANPGLLLVDVREPAEFVSMHIPGALNVPRGVLEAAAEWGYEETEPALAAGRGREVVLVCRSGNRSMLAADTLRRMGFANVASLKSGVRGWKDYEQPLENGAGHDVDLDLADLYFTPRLRPEQLSAAV